MYLNDTIEVFKNYAKHTTDVSESTEELLCRMFFTLKELIIIEELYDNLNKI